MATFDPSLPYFGAAERSMEAMQHHMAAPALNPHFIPIAASVLPRPQPVLQATALSGPPPSHPHPPAPPQPSTSPSPSPLPQLSSSAQPVPASASASATAAILSKPKKPWSEAERTALKDAVIKYRTRRNWHKLPWKLILNDPLYIGYRVDRSKDAIMQQWKGLKKEVSALPLPEDDDEDAEASDSTDSDGSSSSSPSRASSAHPRPPRVRAPAKPKSAAKVKWTDADTATLDEAIRLHGTDWRAILSDPEYAARLKNRNPVSLGKNYHRFHPQGIEDKRIALEEKKRKREAKAEKAALEELSSTSEDDSDNESRHPPPPPQHRDLLPGVGRGGGGSVGGAVGGGAHDAGSAKRRRDEESGSESDGGDSVASSNASTDDESSSLSSPSLSSSTVDAPIQHWEKPDGRDVAHFRRCRHVCGCKSLTADGREFVNSQAVMVRGSRRNHEVNQNLHPQCRGLHRECERLLGPLKEASKGDKKRRKERHHHDGEDDDDALMDYDSDDDHASRTAKKHTNGATNGSHADPALSTKREDNHHSANHAASTPASFGPSSSTPLSPSAANLWSILNVQLQSASGSIGNASQLLRILEQNKPPPSSFSSSSTSSSSTSSSSSPSASSTDVAARASTERYEALLQRVAQQDEEIAQLRNTIKKLHEQLAHVSQVSQVPSGAPVVKNEPGTEPGMAPGAAPASGGS